MKKAQHIINQFTTSQVFFLGYAAIVLLSLFLGIAKEWYFLAGIPAAILLVYLCLLDFKKVFYLLLFFIPLSIEIHLPNGLGTDLPTEPMMVGLMLIFGLFLARHPKKISGDFLRHPITMLLLLHVGWIYLSSLTSSLAIVSIKFSLAKTWYIAVFFFMAGHFIKTVKDFKALFWTIFIPLFCTVIIILVRHAMIDFSFKGVNPVLKPFQRNHVSYAATLSLFLPFVWFIRYGYSKKSFQRIFLTASLGVLLIAIYFTYTRAAYVSLILAIGAYVVFKFRLIKPVLVGVILVGILGSVYMIQDNKYLAYAPNYDKTIAHKRFDNLIEATAKMEDISTMERVHRWVAGFHMSAHHPYVGFGPGNFYFFYQSYTVNSFRTYVSDNPEKSGIHSYYLMTLVEQGGIGLLIFLLLSFYTLIRGETIYHECKDKKRQQIILSLLLSIVIIDSFLLINDLLETDKVGTYFFMCMAILINMDLKNQQESYEST